MARQLQHFCLVLFFAAGIHQAAAFSLLGPYDTWQVFEIGYQLPSDVGGPMNLGEEYRWATPIVTYAFDQSFLEYFGSNGVAAVEDAIKILNDLPPVSTFSNNLSEFPLDSRRINYQASALGMYNLKSFALGALVEELGLASPDRYTWTLRSRVVINNIPFYTTIKRNFDPVTWQPSSYVNGALYTYTILQTYANPDAWESVEIAVDPLAQAVTAVASLGDLAGGSTDFNGESLLFSSGLFFTGLTRDDVGGIRYLIRPNNYNVESLPPGTIGGGAGAGGQGAFLIGGSSANVIGNPWAIAGFTVSNLFSTNAASTNLLSSNLVVTALRPGVDKIKFMRVDFDSLMNAVPTPTILQYDDQYITNSVLKTQSVQRLVTSPDILFEARDLGVNANGIPFLWSRTFSGFINNSALNTAPTGTAAAGPGQNQPPITIQFSNILPYYFNVNGGGEATASIGFVWGAFDGTTNAPAVFPDSVTIQDIEQQVLGGP